MTAEEIRIQMPDDEHKGILSELIPCGWPLTTAEIQIALQPCWSFRDEITIIGGITMKGRRIIPAAIQGKALTASPDPQCHREDKAAGM